MPDDPGPPRGAVWTPWLLVAGIVVAYLAVVWGLRPVRRLLVPRIGVFPAATLLVAALALFGVGLVAVRGRWAASGLTRPGAWRGSAALWPLGIYTVFGVAGLAAGVTVTDPGTVAWVVVLVVLIGLNEEVVYRGVVQDLLSEQGVLVGVAGSAAAFGLVHLNNALLGADPAFVALQVLAATGTGVFFAAVRVRTNTLVPLVVAHALTDLTPFLVRGPGFGGPGTALIEFVPFVGYSWIFAAVGLWMVRGRIREELRPATGDGDRP